MALPTSGQLGLSQIATEIYGSVGTNRSLHAMSLAAGKTTPDTINEFHGYSHVSNILLSWGTETPYSNGSHREVPRTDHVSPQIITINFTYSIGFIDTSWYIYSSDNSTSSWTQEASGAAGSGFSGSFTLPLIDYNDVARIRWSPVSSSYNIGGASISLNGGTLNSGTPVVSVTGTGTWYLL